MGLFRIMQDIANGLYSKSQLHVRDLFLSKLNSDDDFAERLLNPRFNSISRAQNLNDSANSWFS